MKRTAMILLMLAAVQLSASEVIHVIAIPNGGSIFKCGDRCRFRGEVPAAVRLRIFRGTIADLAKLGDAPGNRHAGCIEFDTTIVRPRRSRFDASVLDLNFFFKQNWLAAPNENGNYVFVVERDDHPTGPAIQRGVTLRLPSLMTHSYFEAGSNVTVLAPMNHRPSRIRSSPGRNTGGEQAAMTMSDSGESLTTSPAAPVPAANRQDCVDVQIETNGNTILRSAEADGSVRLGVTRRSTP
jgi:hypothetical protein